MKSDRRADQREIDELGFLVVEEHGRERWDLDRMLHELGASRVSAVASAADAVELLTNEPRPFDIVLWQLDATAAETSLALPEILVRQPAPALIFLSALDSSTVAPYEAAQRSLGVHLLGTVHLPVTPEKLAPLIERLLRSG